MISADITGLFEAVGTVLPRSQRYLLNDAVRSVYTMAALNERLNAGARAFNRGRRRRSGYEMALDLRDGVPDKREPRSYGVRLEQGFRMMRGQP